jgi:PPK2 family polyphosphate:nucleotide phosphotransferase
VKKKLKKIAGRPVKQVASRTRELVQRYRIDKGKGFRLADVDPADTGDLEAEEADRAKDLLSLGVEMLATLQDMLYAQNRWSVLLVFQAMDAAGKDGTIKHVMSGVNPQGVEVYSFKQPSAEDLDHDFLWRCLKWVPERGRIGIFNRSHYEEVLIARVHPEVLARQQLPPELVTKQLWEERYQSIRDFERHLSRNGTMILKFFLHVSKGEQKRRFLARLEEPAKNWKFSASDVRERGYWKAYQQAYQDAIRATAAPHAPWFVVPADHKWFTRLVVAGALVEAMLGLGLHYPDVGPEKRRALEAARRELIRGG